MERNEKPSLYEWLVSNNVLDWVRQLASSLGWTWRYEDGKLYSQIKPAMVETPWHHVKHHHQLRCAMDHQILFDMVFKKLKQNSWVPSRCQNCWKVVVRPKTLKQLFALLDLQKRLDRPSKCGIELRKTTHSNYGGYFYNVGMVEGLECYELVRAEVDKCQHLGPDVEVILKRACTEYEHGVGDSDQWVITEEQLAVEALVDRYVVLEDDLEIRQPELLIRDVHQKWIEFAFERNDPTYAEFTGGKPLHPKYKTYHHWLPNLRTQGVEGVEMKGEYDSAENNK